MTAALNNYTSQKRNSIGSVQFAVKKFENIRHSVAITPDMCARNNSYIKGIVQSRVQLFECNGVKNLNKSGFQRSFSENVLDKGMNSTDSEQTDAHKKRWTGMNQKKIEEPKRPTILKTVSQIDEPKSSTYDKTLKISEEHSGRSIRRRRFLTLGGSSNKEAVVAKTTKPKEPKIVNDWRNNVNLKAEEKVAESRLSRVHKNSIRSRKVKEKEKKQETPSSPRVDKTNATNNVSLSSKPKGHIKTQERKDSVKLRRPPNLTIPSNKETKRLDLEMKALNDLSELVNETAISPDNKDYIRPLSKAELQENYYIVESIKQCYLEQMRQLYLGKLKDNIACNENTNNELDSDFDVCNSKKELQSQVKIYRTEDTNVDELDLEFGYSTFSKEEETSIVEAYNKRSYELVISSLDIQYEQTVEGDNNNNFPNDHKTERSHQSTSKVESIGPPRFSNLEEDTRQISVNSALTNITDSVEISSDSDSYELDDEPELRNVYVNVPSEHRETFYDNNSNPRIEKVTLLNGEATNSTPIERKDFVVEELVITEENYIKDLEKIVLVYKPFVQSYNYHDFPHLVGKHRYLFSNVEDILKESKKFLTDLKKCSYSHEDIGKTFINHRKLFQLYPYYSKNKPYADHYIQEFKPITKAKQTEIGDKLDLASYLLTPIQRLGKYILFLQNITKEINKQGLHSKYVQTALDIVKNAMTRGNDYLAIDSIKNCPKNLSAYGSFVMTDKFLMLKPKKYDSTVFLFNDIVVFTVPDHKNPETFLYVDCIKMEDLTIVIFDAHPLTLHLKDYTKCKKGNSEQFTFILEAKTMKVKQMWQDQLEKRLWEQLSKYKEQVLETYHSGAGERSNPPSRKSSLRLRPPRSKTLPRNTKLDDGKQSSKFYVPLK